MPRKKQLQIVTDPEESAKAAGLRYVTDTKPGIQRKPWRKSFHYFNADGTPVHEAETLARIKSIVIPPAWKEVWICPNPKGHLQVTGRDARGRKQSRYHPRWREVRDETKYERMVVFGAALPAIRERVEHDLSTPGLPRPKVLATIVRLMETTLIRVGNEEYARQNHSYGLTTMRNKHVDVEGATVTFNFQGKSGVKHTVDITDRRIAKIVQRCQDIPGYELFQYVDKDGTQHSIDSSDVNDYLREIAGQDFTAKDFRTWAGSVLACDLLHEFEAFESETQAKRNVVQAIKSVAARLGNTPSVCRKCYVHPAVLDSYMSGAMLKSVKRTIEEKDIDSSHELRQQESALLDVLRRQVDRAVA
ncbi:DNA topoisomerase IB [Tunturiibacter empetritectus]|uniref:DNA topoisomerase n=1 Tax=Tunturiibacter lichenicola TaxID=2051959 RepID=A0A852VQR3_9BACT|nr:DNA topoisomerase IB [Edaphobacter lichenicola]NYF91672.1 DNA topoisomerase-1 [Edaphobacter lichenicola]